jgi:hypothetical protein
MNMNKKLPEKSKRRDRLLRERLHDPYMALARPAGPMVCPECWVVFYDGRWQWQAEPPAGAREALCPACRRIRDRAPAGYLILRGDYFVARRDEILRMVCHQVDYQQIEHPLKRLMGIEDRQDGSALLTFTDMHLPRGIGEAIEHAHQGVFATQHTRDSATVHASWER